ncbi:class 1 fructose-bisphosphatase [Cellvibrio japonicus]|uniref:Fructose-1,6-bisphosphatase class 1 n=1 Tax=Cellvibrio japonicus (strain Ueda107) TaxID=498211 RepID=F16PA_CELJU|nr:class 1 fructose-bisphosphatase [Cellvibrio japonicus]B3PGC8.1 RecName: Full=Fructose-1,6-bisphosphatase class 1; Short=FBPase class 1; AltName: Full=D-fructose-1,6-bisphosphate 1-phosphohydrolase class 1 [Cellvibrio japonicus Ueda107]ACE85656.1 fructose-1,6-bisphosphatase [Cellvibrio japonicus Ueda107]QEI10925.1 class 1 fructose-bisphosphatase [Cellvibrio japonicus]QEI14501.1 class 1 fructose-bisphosphatase [Cellvibrio japonicus]QEI18079.1 class 1 fructose-bisphosphatase [Cellvibrio japoni
MQRLVPTLRRDGVNPELIPVIRTLLAATKEIAFRVRQGALSGVLGSTLDENIQGETQKQLDVIANQLIKDLLLEEPQVRAIASEEEDTVVAGNPKGAYTVAFDPLDGSSNIDINGQIGTIFTIYPARDDVPADSEAQFQQPGHQQVCAGYVLYGPSTILVMTTGGPTRGYTLDATHGSYLLTQAQLSVPLNTQEFALNMANQRFWSAPFQRYVQDLLLGETGPRAKRFNMRWNAAMVGDVHRVLTRGGIFMYPSDNRNPRQPAKLRLLYEANPMAMLTENAGGKAWSENQRILNIQPDSLHQRVAVILGSANEVDVCMSYLLE